MGTKISEWLSKNTCYTFRIALISVPLGQLASFYGFFYFYGYFSIQQDSKIIAIGPNTLICFVLILTLASMLHSFFFGLMRPFGYQWELKRLAIINDLVPESLIEQNLPTSNLSKLLSALSRFPVWNTVAAGVIGSFVFVLTFLVLLLRDAEWIHINLAAQSGLLAILIYMYVTYIISEYLTSSQRSRVKKLLFQRQEDIEEIHLFSLKGKFICFLMIMLTTLLILNSFSFNIHNKPGVHTVLTTFSILAIIIGCMLVIVYFLSITRSIEEARMASETLASGKTDYVFSGGLDKEFVQLNRSIMAAAREVNQYRTKMETVVNEKTTALEQSLAKLNKSENRFRSMVENGSDVIAILDDEGYILFETGSVERVFGYKPEELIGTIGFNLIHPEDRSMVLEAFAEGVKIPNETRTIEYRYRHKDGSWRHLESVSKNLLHDPAVNGIVVTSRDITERKEAEEKIQKYQEHLEELVEERTVKLKKEITERKQVEQQIRLFNEALEKRVRKRTAELEKAYADLKELDKMKDRFLSLVSHELRTPLTSIRSFSEILIRYKQEDAATQQEFLEIINSESERLTRLIDDILDLSKIEAGKMVWHDTFFAIEEVIRDVVKAQHQLLQEKSLKLILEIPEDLPSIHADRDRIQQIMMNLLGNAIKFSLNSGGIHIMGEQLERKDIDSTARWLKISIADQGIGIDKNSLDIIFDRFRQGDSDTLQDKPKGTGLGLHICKEIVSHYGGEITVESQKGKGSTFHVLLPVDHKSASEGKSKHDKS